MSQVSFSVSAVIHTRSCGNAFSGSAVRCRVLRKELRNHDQIRRVNFRLCGRLFQKDIGSL